jgi:hypothetical protein
MKSGRSSPCFSQTSIRKALVRRGGLRHLHIMKGADFLDYDFVREWVGAYDGMMSSFRYFVFLLLILFSAPRSLTQSTPLSRSSRYHLIIDCHPSLPRPQLDNFEGVRSPRLTTWLLLLRENGNSLLVAPPSQFSVHSDLALLAPVAKISYAFEWKYDSRSLDVGLFYYKITIAESRPRRLS